MKSIKAVAIAASAGMLLVGMRWLFPERPMSYVGVRAIIDSIFALGLLAFVLLLAGSLGWKVQRLLRLESLSDLERAVFGLALGLGILAYGVLVLGLIGVLRPLALFLWLLVVGLWTWREWSEFIGRMPGWLARKLRQASTLAWWQKAILAIAGLLLGMSLLDSLTPPWDYDALMYHLQAPRLFLEEGRLLLLPDTWQANGPLTIEMLFAVGLAFGSDVFAKLLHLACAVLLVLATFSAGRRLLGHAEGWVASALLLGIPFLPTWAAMANIDMGWALYEFLALYALILWRESRNTRFLFLAALMAGWALGSKYLALGGLGVLGLWVLWQGRHIGWKRAMSNAAIFGALALCIALPWYAKNWLWAGNPFYPFLFGGKEWGEERLGYLMTLLRSYGAGHRLIDYLVLPWNLYVQNARFSTIGVPFEIPGLLIPLAILYPFGQRHRAMDALAGLALLRLLVWALGSQQTRFLLPILPSLALLGSAALLSLSRRLQSRWGGAKAVPVVVAGVALAATLMFQIVMLGAFPPAPVLLGKLSKSDFLRQRVANHRAVEVVQDRLGENDRVWLMWSGVVYYCGERCVSDAGLHKWRQVAQTASGPEGAAEQLRASQVTHLMYSQGEARWVAQHDVTGLYGRSTDFFLHDFLPNCADVIYRDEGVILAEITCP